MNTESEHAHRERDTALFDQKADSLLTAEELLAKKSRYESFDAEREIAKITRHFFNTEPARVTSLRAANAIDHLVFGVDVMVGGTIKALVFRINADSHVETHLLVEEMLYAAIGSQGIGAPKVYAAALRGSDFSYDVMIAERIGTGDLETHLRDNTHDAETYTKKAGAYLAELHRLRFPGFGTFSLRAAERGQLEAIQSSWQDVLHTKLADNVEFLVRERIITAEVGAHARAAMEKAPDLPHEETVFLHGDYHDANVLIDANSGSVVGAIDLSGAKVGDRVFDIAFYSTYVPDERLEWFLEGYREKGHLDATFKERLALYRLRIFLSKAKLRRRLGYEARIGEAVQGVHTSLKKLESL
jgi:aminoglycoside phosphotransferase (APT) family kinase protein